MAQASSANTPKFNLSAIMRHAWELHRRVRELYADWQIREGIVDGSFATALRMAWEDAKAEARRLANMAGPNGERIRDLRDQIEWIKYKGFGHRVADETRRLRAEIARLEAA